MTVQATGQAGGQATGSDVWGAFRAHLARHRSVTEALAEWCADRDIGAGPIRAERVPAAGRAAAAASALALAEGETVTHRRVRLVRGRAALLEAETLYVPERLPRGVHRALTETDAPFGALLAAHGFARVPLGAGEAGDEGQLVTAAVVTLGGRPVAQVRERFSRGLLQP